MSKIDNKMKGMEKNMLHGKEHLINIYEKDCEFYKYHDELKWNRFQTAALIEGGILYAIYNLKIENHEKLIMLVIGTLIIFLIYLLFLRSEVLAYDFLNRIILFEKEWNIKFEKKKSKWPPRGSLSGKAVWFILFVFNIFLFVNTLVKTK